MLRSMTGFGRCFVENEGGTQQWEIRSVNGRYLDIKWRLPPLVRFLEPTLEKLVRQKASRGRVEISLNLQFGHSSLPVGAFDASLAAGMLDAVGELAARRGDTFQPDYTALLQIPALWHEPGLEEGSPLWASLGSGLTIALDDWNESREMEGVQLGHDLQERIAQMEAWLQTLASNAPDIKEERLTSLRGRLEQVLNTCNAELDEGRFLQEIVLLTDRLDVSEELTRLGAHLARLRRLLLGGPDAGRKLDFTLQECFREINTCGNKLQDADLSPLVVDFKNELEKCREQAQNLE